MENEIWEKEMILWDHAKKGKVLAYESMLHERFSDWPSSMAAPLFGIEEMMAYIRGRLENLDYVNFDLNHQGTQIIDENEVIVYFSCKIAGKLNDGTSIDSNNRMMHIWRKSKGDFKLLSGFQAAV